MPATSVTSVAFTSPLRRWAHFYGAEKYRWSCITKSYVEQYNMHALCRVVQAVDLGNQHYQSGRVGCHAIAKVEELKSEIELQLKHLANNHLRQGGSGG